MTGGLALVLTGALPREIERTAGGSSARSSPSARWPVSSSSSCAAPCAKGTPMPELISERLRLGAADGPDEGRRMQVSRTLSPRPSVRASPRAGRNSPKHSRATPRTPRRNGRATCSCRGTARRWSAMAASSPRPMPMASSRSATRSPPSLRGQGYATEAARRLVDFAFGAGAKTVIAHSPRRNQRLQLRHAQTSACASPANRKRRA